RPRRTSRSQSRLRHWLTWCARWASIGSKLWSCPRMTTTSAEDRVQVLLVDDDEDDFVLTRDLLTEIPSNRFRLVRVDSYEQGLSAASSGRYDVILLDYSLGSRTGLELLTELRRLGCDVPVIILTG